MMLIRSSSLAGPRGMSEMLTIRREPPWPVSGSYQGIRAAGDSSASNAAIRRGQYSLGRGLRRLGYSQFSIWRSVTRMATGV